MVVFWVLMRCVTVTMIILCHDGLSIHYKENFCYQKFLLCFYDHTKCYCIFKAYQMWNFLFSFCSVSGGRYFWRSFICTALETRFVCVILFFYFPFSSFDWNVIYLLVGTAWMILIQIIQIFTGNLPNMVLVDGSVYLVQATIKLDIFSISLNKEQLHN